MKKIIRFDFNLHFRWPFSYILSWPFTAFSTNHEVEFIKDVQSTISEGALVIATVDDPKQNVFKLVEVGEIK